MGYRFICWTVLASCMFAPCLHAQSIGSIATDAPAGFRITPSLLTVNTDPETDEKAHTTAGLEYTFNQSWGPASGASPDGLNVVLNAEGRAAFDRKEKVGDLLDVNASLRYRKLWLPLMDAYGRPSVSWYGYATAVLKGGLQSDQTFDTRHTVLSAELRTSMAHSDTPAYLVNAWPALILGYERVKPNDDQDRRKVDPGLAEFSRAHGRLSSSLIVGKLASSQTLKLEFKIDHWRETSPPTAIRAAGLDRQTFRAIALRLAASEKDDGWSITYGSGNVPTDQKSAKVWQIGYSFVGK
jgi:hypothetical protein